MLIKIFFLVFSFFFSSYAYSRFYHLDADEIDNEDSLSSEYYNDIYSYNDPVGWDRIFQASQAAYRGWAGSLNVDRSYLLEDIKLLSSKERDPMELQFHQHREEDLLTQYLTQEARLQINSPWGLYIATMIDAVSFKKWDDFGAALGFQNGSERKIEFSVWAVDYYYNSKEDNRGDRYHKIPLTYSGNLKWTLWDAKIIGSAFYDRPMEWERVSRSYTYENSRSVFNVRVESPYFLDSYHMWVRSYQELKKEAKIDSTSLEKTNLFRRVGEYAFGLQREKNKQTTEVSITHFQRKANYDLQKKNGSVIEFSKQIFDRREWMFAATHHLPFFSNFFQWGLFCNRVRKEMNEIEQANEVKLQTAFDFRISNKGFVLVNATWDIDQIAETQLNPFRPWGGGSINLMIAL